MLCLCQKYTDGMRFDPDNINSWNQTWNHFKSYKFMHLPLKGYKQCQQLYFIIIDKDASPRAKALASRDVPLLYDKDLLQPLTLRIVHNQYCHLRHEDGAGYDKKDPLFEPAHNKFNVDFVLFLFTCQDQATVVMDACNNLFAGHKYFKFIHQLLQVKNYLLPILRLCA